MIHLVHDTFITDRPVVAVVVVVVVVVSDPI